MAGDAPVVGSAQIWRKKAVVRWKIILGGEWAFNNLLSMRFGINENEITTGIGLKFNDWGLDYAFAYYQDFGIGGVADLAARRIVLGFHLQFRQKNIRMQAASVRWQKKGDDVLAQLKTCFADKAACSSDDDPEI